MHGETKRFTLKWLKNAPKNQLKKCVRALANARVEITAVYLNFAVPFLVDHLRFFLVPGKFFLNVFKIRFVANIALGTGHIISDFDHFLRLRHSKILSDEYRYIIVFKNHVLSSGFADVYPNHNVTMLVSSLLHFIILPFCLAFPELVVDVGLSRLKTRLRVNSDKTTNLPYEQSISKGQGYKQWLRYYELKNKTRDYQPLKIGVWDNKKLIEFIGGEQIAVIHLKTNIRNATALPTDPLSYLPTIRYLQSIGMKIVKIGTEKLPFCFKELGVIDYPNSSLANFSNDLNLIKMANIVIASGSGVGWLPDLMDVPQVYVNFWHIFTPPYSKYCVLVPTLIYQNGKNEKFLSYDKQFDVYMKAEDIGDEIFPSKYFTARNATSDEILEATKECLKLAARPVPLSTEQLKFASADKEGWLKFAECRISNYFVTKHPAILDETVAKSW